MLKRTIVAPVARLSLKNDAAKHKFKLIAGARWTPEPPRDSGIGASEDSGSHGYVKISCEDFPQPAMNLKWASDALDRLIAEANVSILHNPTLTRVLILASRAQKTRSPTCH